MARRYGGLKILQDIVAHIDYTVGTTATDHHQQLLKEYAAFDGPSTELNEHELQTRIAYGLLFGARDSAFSYYGRQLGGGNVFARSLVSTGWQFWRKPLLSPKEAEIVKVAYLDAAKHIGRTSGMAERLQRNPLSTTREVFKEAAQILSNVDQAFVQFSTELKQLLSSAE